jgi:subtilisin family serine protease
MARIASLLVLALALLAVGASEPLPSRAGSGGTEVVVTLAAPPLAFAPGTAGRVEAQQRAFRRELADVLPEARVGWRYRLVANGFAVALPSEQVPVLRELPGVQDVFAATAYGPQLDQTPRQIGATALWGPGLETSGQGVKIGIIDSGVDKDHRFFDPAGYTMPAGFPKGQQAYTTAKVIAARVFAPAGALARSAKVPFHAADSNHGTHVAGIAAGNARTQAVAGRMVSGVAPGAYIGNYKVFVQTDSGISPNANSPAIVAAIEAAVADGMDVINFSGGEPEIEPSRDIVALALDAAAAAGVVPVVAAGNDYSEAGAGSVSSPGNSARAITVGAVEIDETPPSSVHASFSSVGPTTISLRLKPDVAAPGVSVLSSVPNGWSRFSGTSMASPHVAGAAALLRQRHPAWTVAEIKSALVSTGSMVAEGDSPAGPSFVGGGLIVLREADRPLVLTDPTAVSFGLLNGHGFAEEGRIGLSDAGGGEGIWDVSIEPLRMASGASVVIGTSQVSVPGELAYEVRVADSAQEGDVSGYFTLRRGTDVRRIPFWGRVTALNLQRHKRLQLRTPGIYRGTTLGRQALVSRYRYPEDPRGVGVTTALAGPEVVYRFRLTRPTANFGVVVLERAPRSRVEPRVVSGLDENRLTGYAGLPVVHNPYLEEFRTSALAAGALSPLPGEYAIVFDSATRAGAGRFTFRFWVNDVTPPTLRLRTRVVDRGGPVLVAATDAGSGVYPNEIPATVDGRRVSARYRRGVVRIDTGALAPGKHRLRLRVSDYQETKNTENVARILPNTRTLTATFTIGRR